MYIDSPSGEASEFFLSNGLEASQLVPVNWDQDACDELRNRFKCNVLCGDIFNVMGSYVGICFTAIWLDLEEAFVTRSDAVRCLKLARNISEHIFLTTTTRPKSYEYIFLKMDDVTSKSGLTWVKSMPYQGVNGANMLFTTLQRRQVSPLGTAQGDSQYFHLLSADNVSHVAKHSSNPIITVYRDAVHCVRGRAKYRARSTTSPHDFYVHACDSISFDFFERVDCAWKSHYKYYLSGQVSRSPRSSKILAHLLNHTSNIHATTDIENTTDANTVTIRTDPPDLKRLIGTRLLVPLSHPAEYASKNLWKNKWTVNGKVECIVTGTFRHRRLTVCAFERDGIQCRKMERWVPLPEEVERFRVISGQAHIVLEKGGD